MFFIIKNLRTFGPPSFGSSILDKHNYRYLFCKFMDNRYIIAKLIKQQMFVLYHRTISPLMKNAKLSPFRFVVSQYIPLQPEYIFRVSAR